MNWRDRVTLCGMLKLYLVMDLQGTKQRTALDIAKEAIRGGVRTLQIRDKRASDEQWMTVGHAIRTHCAEQGVLFIVNDRLDMTVTLAADGIHVGQDDTDVETIRQRLGQQLVIGLSVGDELEWTKARTTSADYYGVGAVYATFSKADAGVPIGTTLIARIAASTSIPIVGIGGIHANNARAVIEAGACGVAVLSAIGHAENPYLAAQQIRNQVG